MPAPLLEVRDLTKHFPARGGPVTAVDNLSLSVGKGEFVSVVGPSGGGKTTAVRLLSGLLPPSSGQVLLEGKPVMGPPAEMLVVFQQYEKSLLPWRSVAANVSFGLENLPLSRQERQDRIAQALEAVGLSDAARQFPHQLSGGMQQRVAIARALARRPRIMLMDEPFSSLDALTRGDLQDLLLTLWREQEQTILFVTHDVDEAVYLGNRVLVLTPRPARVREEVPVALPYPRDQVQTREDRAYLEARRHIFDLIRPGRTHHAIVSA